MKCPGTDSRFLKAGLYKCPRCGYKVEIFSDELRRRCPACKTLVYREKTPSCVQWCRYAKECIGEQKWKELNESAEQKEH